MESKPKRYSIKFLTEKLREMYEIEDGLLSKVEKIYFEYEQLQEDIELIKTMIMHQYNKVDRNYQFKK